MELTYFHQALGDRKICQLEIKLRTSAILVIFRCIVQQVPIHCSVAFVVLHSFEYFKQDLDVQFATRD